MSTSPVRPIKGGMFAAFTMLLVALLITACGRGTYPSSGLPETLLAKSVLERVGASQGVQIRESTGGTRKDEYSHEEHRQYTLTLASGTAGQYVSGLRAELEKLVLAAGQTVYGTEMVAPAELRDFAFRYAGDQHSGLVRVYAADTVTNTFRLILFCYEHRK